MDYAEQDLKLSFPETLWEKITARYQEDEKFKENKYDFFEGIPVVVSVSSDKKSVLNEPYYKITLNPLGGQIDFADLVGTKEKGSIQVYFTPDISEEDMKNLKIYYLSSSQKRKIGDEYIGNGCNKLMDLTQYFHNEVLKKNLPLHTGQLRYLSTMAGKFYFVIEDRHQLRVSQITFKDSRHTDITCEGKI